MQGKSLGQRALGILKSGRVSGLVLELGLQAKAIATLAHTQAQKFIALPFKLTSFPLIPLQLHLMTLKAILRESGIFWDWIW